MISHAPKCQLKEQTNPACEILPKQTTQVPRPRQPLCDPGLGTCRAHARHVVRHKPRGPGIDDHLASPVSCPCLGGPHVHTEPLFAVQYPTQTRHPTRHPCPTADVSLGK